MRMKTSTDADISDLFETCHPSRKVVSFVDEVPTYTIVEPRKVLYTSTVKDTGPIHSLPSGWCRHSLL